MDFCEMQFSHHALAYMDQGHMTGLISSLVYLNLIQVFLC